MNQRTFEVNIWHAYSSGHYVDKNRRSRSQVTQFLVTEGNVPFTTTAMNTVVLLKSVSNADRNASVLVSV